MLIQSELPNNFIQLRKLDKYLFGHKGYIAGGCFKNLFNGEKIKDIDIFFKEASDQKEAVEYFKKSEYYEEHYKNEKVDSFKEKSTGIVIELIKYVFGDHLEIISKFDFTVTKFGYVKEIIYLEDDENGYEISWEIVYDDKFFEHLHLKRLVINDESLPLRNPLNTFNRSYRYAKYGYFPCLETKKHLVNEIRNSNVFNLNDIGGELYNGLD